MIRFTWLQFRAQAAAAAVVLAVAAVALVVTGLHLAHLFASSGAPQKIPTMAGTAYTP